MAEDLRRTTIDSYNQSAVTLAEYFRGIGPREKYIDLAIELAGSPTDPNILEIGCGDGRDASAIVQRTPNYLGTDVSEEAIKLAREHVPDGRFEVADAATQEFTQNLDVCYAFASVLHLSKPELQTVFRGLHKALRPGGVFYISTKVRPEYTEEVKEDQFGKRLFYYYTLGTLIDLAGDDYEAAIEPWYEQRGSNTWLELALTNI